MSDRTFGIIIIFASLSAFLLLAFFLDRDIVFFLRVKTLMAVKEKERVEIIKTINLYNKILTDFYASDGNPLLLNNFPGSILLRHHTFRDIGFLQSHNRVLVYDMADVLPVKIDITGPQTAEAIVLERWNYIYQKRPDREIISNIKGMGRGFKYYLYRAVDHWIIGDYEPVDVEEPPEKEFKF